MQSPLQASRACETLRTLPPRVPPQLNPTVGAGWAGSALFIHIWIVPCRVPPHRLSRQLPRVPTDPAEIGPQPIPLLPLYLKAEVSEAPVAEAPICLLPRPGAAAGAGGKGLFDLL